MRSVISWIYVFNALFSHRKCFTRQHQAKEYFFFFPFAFLLALIYLYFTWNPAQHISTACETKPNICFIRVSMEQYSETVQKSVCMRNAKPISFAATFFNSPICLCWQLSCVIVSVSKRMVRCFCVERFNRFQINGIYFAQF